MDIRKSSIEDFSIDQSQYGKETVTMFIEITAKSESKNRTKCDLDLTNIGIVPLSPVTKDTEGRDKVFVLTLNLTGKNSVVKE
jgi:hypothetical protein